MQIYNKGRKKYIFQKRILSQKYQMKKIKDDLLE